MRDKEYRAFWNNKMWDVLQIDYKIPQTVILTDEIKDWHNIDLSDVKLMKNTWEKDISGEYVFEGDFLESHQGSQILDILMMVKFGTYAAYCPVDNTYMDNVGFFVEAKGYPSMPLGPVNDYAKVLGNLYDNPELLEKEV